MRRVAILLFAVFAASSAIAGGRVELAGRAVFGNVLARVTAGGRAVEGTAWVSLQFGPSFPPCSDGLGWEEVTLGLLGLGSTVSAYGTWSPGHAGLALHPSTLSEEIRDAYLGQCEETASSEACFEEFAKLDLKFRRTQLLIRTQQRDGAASARVRGRFLLELIDPQGEAAPFAWSLDFREAAPLAVHRPVSFGFCGIFFPLGG